MIPKPIVSVIAIVVTAVWVGAFVLDVLVPNYEVNPMIHAAFMAIIGMAFTMGRKGNDSDGPGGAHRKTDE